MPFIFAGIFKLLPPIFGAPCPGNTFFFLPPWWKYLDSETDVYGGCSPIFVFPGDTWSVALAVIEMLLRIAGLVAVIMVVIGGAKYMTAMGNTEKTASARRSIINALIGLGITAIASALVAFIGNRLG